MNDLDQTTDGYDELVDTEEGWEPIGDDDNEFTGTFDGDEHEISDLYIDRPNTNYIGLFGCVDDGEVRNVGIIDAEVNGGSRVGGLVGDNRSTMSNSYAAGDVSGDEQVGGLVGVNDEGMVEKTYASGNVTGNWRVGGLVGYDREGDVSDSFWDIETTD